MKEHILNYLLIILLFSSMSHAASVTRTLPQPINPGTTIDVTLKITQGTPGELFTLEETIPSSVEVIDFTVDGAIEDKKDISTRREGNALGWSFSPKEEEATITYTAKVSPQASGKLTFQAVFFDPNGFNQHESIATVATPSLPILSTTESNAEPQTPVITTSPSPSPPIKGNEKKPVQAQGQRPSLAVGIFIIILIVLGGLAVFYYFTKSKKHQGTFNDTFFKKQK